MLTLLQQFFRERVVVESIRLCKMQKGPPRCAAVPFAFMENLSVWKKRMACYFTSASWVFLTRLRITAPSALPTASATQYSTA